MIHLYNSNQFKWGDAIIRVEKRKKVKKKERKKKERKKERVDVKKKERKKSQIECG